MINMKLDTLKKIISIKNYEKKHIQSRNVIPMYFWHDRDEQLLWKPPEKSYQVSGV